MGRRSSVELLDKRLKDEVDRLVREGRTIDDIVEHLQGLGGDASRSSIGRYAKKARDKMERYREAQQVAAVWVQKITEDPTSDVGRLNAEMLKTVAYQQLSEMGDGDAKVDPGDIMVLARAIKDLEIAGRHNLQRELEIRKAAVQAAAKKVGTAGKKAGLSAEAIRQIEEEVLGIVRQ